MEIEFDSDKDALNRAKHRVPLADAAILLAASHVVTLDDRFEYGEERWRAVGEIGGRLHVCIYTERARVYRIISLRKANRREINAHRENHTG